MNTQNSQKKNLAWLWILLSVIVVLFCCVMLAVILWTQRASIPGLSNLLATSTKLPNPTPTITSTRTPPPTVTATPVPTWVTEFAQPILNAISDRPPDFQDDFGVGSAGWQGSYCPGSFEKMDGELVLDDCRVIRPNINYKDFVIEFDWHFVPGAASDSSWIFNFRNIDTTYHVGPTYSIVFEHNGNVGLRMGEGNEEYFPGAANYGDQSNHILIIGKGEKFAVYLNDRPFYSFDSSQLTYGDFQFMVDDTIIAIDNVRVWNISDITIP